jgi:predicted transcriptional regulator of viral defense system
MLHTTQAIRLGIAPRTLYQMRDEGALVELARGLFRLARLPSLSQPDLVTASLKVPKGVVCLISALAYHDLTTQIPHEVDIALPAGTPAPKLTYPPIQVFHFSKESYRAGIETHEIDGVTVRIYSAEKTVVDCFKFRNQLGMEIVLESLKRYRERKGFRIERLYNFAKVCRMTNVMRPYLEMVA